MKFFPHRHWLLTVVLTVVTFAVAGVYTVAREVHVAMVASDTPLAGACELTHCQDDPEPIVFGSIRDGRATPLRWHRKDGRGAPMNPGCNRFSKDNVWIDERGRLHLALRERVLANGESFLHSAEIVATQPLGWGAYEVVVESDPADLPANVVLGLFTYVEEPAVANREFDIELSRWSEPDAPNAQFVSHFLSPAGDIGRLRGRFEQSGTGLTHVIDWRETEVLFRSGEFTGRAVRFVPAPGDARFRLNLWRHRGSVSALDVVINDITFTPRDGASGGER